MPRRAKKAPATAAASGVKELERAVVPIAHLNAATYNPRTIDDDALKALEKSVSKFGLVQEIVVNKPTMTIISGHQRLKIIKGKYESVPVVFVDLDPTEEKALNVALNSDQLTGTFTDSLQDILLEIEATRGDLFDDLRLDELLTEIADDTAKDNEVEYKSKWEVVIECESEEKQQELYERFNEEGLSVKLLSA